MLRKFKVNVNGKSYLVELEELNPQAVEIGDMPANQPQRPVVSKAVPVAETVPTPIAPAQEAKTTEVVEGTTLEAPMPGNILDVKVKVGDQVHFEQPLIVLEAMKMENELVAPKDGIVQAIYVAKGDAIDVGKPMITIG